MAVKVQYQQVHHTRTWTTTEPSPTVVILVAMAYLFSIITGVGDETTTHLSNTWSDAAAWARDEKNCQDRAHPRRYTKKIFFFYKKK